MRWSPFNDLEVMKSDHYVTYLLVQVQPYYSPGDFPSPQDPNWIEPYPEWAISATWGRNATDDPIEAATIVVGMTSDDGQSLSPLITKSGSLFYEYLKNGTAIRILTCVRPANSPAPTNIYEYMHQWYGYIDKIDFKSEKLTLTCRDLGARVMDTYIQQERTYCLEPEGWDPEQQWLGLPMETVMRQILDDNGLQNIPLYVPVSPGANLGPFLQKQESVLLALQNLSKQIGWHIYYTWSYPDIFNLTLFAPDKDKSIYDVEFGPDHYINITQMMFDFTNLRNVVEVEYIQRNFKFNVGDPPFYPITVVEIAPTIERVIAKDDDSIAKYGTRYMKITEGSTSSIDSLQEATDLANVALYDLVNPIVHKTIDLPYFWMIQNGDLIRFSSNNYHYDSDIEIACIGYSHTVERNAQRTTIRTRGIVATNYEQWLRNRGYNIRARTYDAEQISDPNYNRIIGETFKSDEIKFDPMLDAVLDDITQGTKIIPRKPFNAGTVSGNWVPNFENGAAQRILCNGDTVIEFPDGLQKEILRQTNTMHLYINCNGHTVTFGQGYAFPGGDPGIMEGECHANFILNHDNYMSGVVLSDVRDPNEVIVQI